MKLAARHALETAVIALLVYQGTSCYPTPAALQLVLTTPMPTAEIKCARAATRYA